MNIKFLKPKQKTLVVFVKNKLITIDAIMPLLLEMKQVYNVQSNIVVFDQLAHKGINENVVIRDALHHVGKELYITRGEKNIILRRIYVIFSLLFIIYDALKGAKLIHFGVLNQWPLNILGYAFKKNVYHVQGNAYNFEYSQYKNIAGNKPIKKTSIGDNIVAFGKKHRHKQKGKAFFNFGSTRKRDIWLQYVYDKSDYYFNRYHGNIDTSKGIIVVIMSSLDGHSRILKKQQSEFELFENTINVLSKFSNKFPIFIKPHVYTDMNLLNGFISNKENFNITYLHPSILATKSRIFIANQFSNTLADAYSLGVATIEYTDYSDIMLEATQGKSIDYKFVNYFINNDINIFEQSIANILDVGFNVQKYKGKSDDDSGLLAHLAR